MLSRIAAPKASGPPNASCASSKTIWILLTAPVTGTREKLAGQVMVGVGATQTARRGGVPLVLPQRSLIHPSPRISESGGGELHPRKKNPVVVRMLNRGAPAPQCDPNMPACVPGPYFLMS